MWIKTLTGLLAVVMILGCSGGRQSKGEEKKVGLIIYNEKDKFISTVGDAVERAAVGLAKVVRYDAHNSQEEQNDLVQKLIAEDGVQALIINVVDRNAAPLISEMAARRKLPLVFINREPEESIILRSNLNYYVGVDPENSGQLAIEILTEAFKETPALDLNGDGIIQYVVIMGEPNHQDTVLRTRAYGEAFKANKEKGGLGGEELMREQAYWRRDLGKEKMQMMLETLSDRIEAVISNNDEMALGAIEALEEAGYFDGHRRYMPVIGNDGIPEAIDAIGNGTLLGTLLNNNVEQGGDALNIALALIEGVNPQPEISVQLSNANRTSNNGRYVWIPYEKVTKENYRSYIKKSK